MKWLLKLFDIKTVKPYLINKYCRFCNETSYIEVYYKYLTNPINSNNMTIITKCTNCNKGTKTTYKEL